MTPKDICEVWKEIKPDAVKLCWRHQFFSVYLGKKIRISITFVFWGCDTIGQLMGYHLIRSQPSTLDKKKTRRGTAYSVRTRRLPLICGFYWYQKKKRKVITTTLFSDLPHIILFMYIKKEKWRIYTPPQCDGEIAPFRIELTSPDYSYLAMIR